ncbi:MAG: hypothetical protein ACI9PZ_003283 [Parvicella sp.]|jgi:hypothetical protein
MIKSYALICFLLLSACASTPSVYSDYDKAHSFSEYKTFSWAQESLLMVSGNFPITKETKNKATQSIIVELALKGFKFVEQAENADFLVSYTLGAKDDIEIYQSDSSVYDNKESWLWGREYHSSYFDTVIDEGLRRSYINGVIGVDIFDTKLQAPVWHGKATKPLDESEILSGAETIGEAVKAVLSSFPPKI